MNKSILGIFIFLFLVSFVSANGLTVIGDTSFEINHTIGFPDSIIIQLKNEDVYTFKNISFEENSFISMDEISELASGAEVNITATIMSNFDVDETVRIVGYYESTIGTSNETYYVDVDYDNGIDPCQLDIIKGDTVIWQNNVSDEIKMWNSATDVEITTILENSTYSSLFDSPEILDYHFTRRGFEFTDTCRIVAVDDSGLVTNPSLDAIFHLKINTNYEPTTIGVTFIETNYTMDFYDKEEGILTIKNTGEETAKNILLSGDWMSFSSNAFDLSPGQTKGIIYEISPQVSYTNETDKQYYKNLTIEGNFEKYSQEIRIYINYADIDSGNISSQTSLIDAIIEYCQEHPEESFCNTEPKIVYRDSNNTEFNVTFSQEQVKEIFEYMFEEGDAMEEFRNYLKEREDQLLNQSNFTLTEMGILTTRITNVEENQNEANNNLYLFIMAFLIAIIILIMVYMAKTLIKDKKAKSYRRWK